MKYIIIILAVLVAYFFPKKYGEHLSEKYFEDFVSFPIATITAVLAVVAALLWEQNEFWFWFFTVLLALFCVYFIARIIFNGICAGANPFEIILAILAQVLATAGIFCLILLIIGVLLGSDNKKKRRRRR